MPVEEAFREGVKKFVENINLIVLLTTWLTILALFGISIGMISTHHSYPWLAVYCMLVSFLMGMVEAGAAAILRFNSENIPWLVVVQERMEEFLRWITPIKKCIIYIVIALPLFIHFTVATVGGLLVMLTALFLAVQFEPGTYSPLGDDDEGPLTGISAGDVILPGSQGGNDVTTTGEVVAPAPRDVSPNTAQEWDLVKDENLLLG